jgi:sigma-B regulation protein RsbU (phosphoserine phosphatase)
LARQTERDRELDGARRMQSAFLPDRPPVLPGWQVSALFRPARPMSGDFYDWFPMGGGRRLGFVIADVCDKGYGAALLMTPLRTLIRHEAASADRSVLPRPRGSDDAAPLRAAVDAVNRYLLRDHPGQGHFATLFVAMLDPESGLLRYVNAGHHPPVALRADGRHQPLRVTGPAVGLFDEVGHEVAVDRLDPGDFLLGYTDGLVEARSADGVAYGAQRVRSAARAAARDSADGLLEGMETDLDHHLGPLTPQDDLTLLAVRRLPESDRSRRRSDTSLGAR